ncbi:MAG: periplasmic heavy metal sensor [Pseudomonadota bacterium]
MTTGRIFRIAFVVVACVSLLINAVIIGVGARLVDRGFIDGSFGQSIRDMPRETRQAFLKGFRAERQELRRLGDELRERRTNMLALASRQPVDPDALAAAMQQVRKTTTDLQTAVHQVMLKTARQGSDDN